MDDPEDSRLFHRPHLPLLIKTHSSSLNSPLTENPYLRRNDLTSSRQDGRDTAHSPNSEIRVRSVLNKASSKSTPLPYLKLLPLLIARVSEGLVFSVIFPYINEMFLSFGVPEKSVGVWSATAESMMMVTEAFAAPLYAPLADRLGRRPVVLVLTLLWGTSAVAFGLMRNVWGVVIMRACLGMFAGAGVLARTMLGELCDKSNRAKGFAVFTPALTIGVTLGPVIGGSLSKPVPRLLSPSWTVLQNFPYLLPALVAGVVALSAFFFGTAFLPETLPASMRRKSHVKSEKQASPSLAQLFKFKRFQEVLVLYGITNAVQFSWEAVYPLYAFTRTDLGGLGLPTQSIGFILGCGAALSIILTLTLYPYLHSRISENLLLRTCLTSYAVAVGFFPVIWAVNYHSLTRMNYLVRMLLGSQMILRRIGDFSATILDTMMIDAIPGPEYLAMANSLTFSVAAIGRAIGPFIVSYLFSLSTRFTSPYSSGRQIVWVTFCLLSLPGIVLASNMRSRDDDEVEEQERYGLLGHIRKVES